MERSCRTWSMQLITVKVLRKIAGFSTMATGAVVQDNVKMILDSIGEACKKSSLSKRCRLVAVSKTKPVELIAACYAVGQRHFGENYVQAVRIFYTSIYELMEFFIKIRGLKCRVFEGPPGSAYAEFGGTKVLARVYGPTDDPNGDSNAASLSLKMKGLPNTNRIASQVLSVIKTCVMVHKYSQCCFDIEVTVLSDEGGLLQCALMAATLALADAEVLVLDVVVAAHVARTPSGEWIVDPTSDQIIVCCDIRGGHLTSSQIDEFITFATDKAMKLYPTLVVVSQQCRIRIQKRQNGKPVGAAVLTFNIESPP
ncbi:3' exoribonuclease family, domain 1, partial [Teladorsagia circumcincta]